MSSVLCVMAGGACGAAARHTFGAWFLKYEKGTFPLGTFLINLAGSLLLGILCGLKIRQEPYLLLGDGFCGAFTTFSTFSTETVQMIRGHARRKALLFIALSVVCGVLLFTAGYMAASAIRIK